MASPNLPRRRPCSEIEDNIEPTASEASSPKRPRLNPADSEADATDADFHESGSDESDENQGDGEGSDAGSDVSNSSDVIANPPQITAHDGLGPGGYKPGAIVRIKVKNFVTYTAAEFFPGPKLNMVIGPNGTGKSTLVCAICLGLGWGPQHLGRAKDLGEFVKHGSKEAIIEIELCGPPKTGHNPIIQRTIKRDGNKTSFTLDGQPASKSEVLKLAQSFAIQVDNLCQFLPQDKVAEFAALSPIELLHSTQRAAAGPEMLAWHDALKTLRSKQKKLELDNSGEKETLVNLENRQEMQRADVEKMRERAEIKRRIEILELCRPIVHYKEHFETVRTLREEKAHIEQEYRQLKADNEPILLAVQAKENYIAELNGAKDDRKDAADHAASLATRHGNEIDKFDAKIKALDAQIDAERKSSKDQKAQATHTQQTIKKLERQLEEEAVEFNPESYNEALREKRLQRRDLETKGRAIKDRRDPLVEEGRQVQRQLKQAETQLANLDSASGQQELKLTQASRDSMRAYTWILENQDKFEKEVFGPPMVTCSVTDPKFADAIESLFQKSDFTTFTTQTRADFRTLQKELLGTMGLHDITIKTCSLSLESMKPQMSNDQIRQQGFDGWARDFITGPDPVLAMLCSEKNLHMTPIGLRDITEEQFNHLENGTLSSWVSGKSSYQVSRRREYGPGAKSTRVRQLQPAKVWTSQPVDQNLRREYEEKITGWNEQIQELKARIQDEEAMGSRIKNQLVEVDEEMRNIEKEKEIKQTAQTHYRAIPEKIAQQQAKLASLTAMFDSLRDRVRDLRNEQDDCALKKAEAAVVYANTIESYSQALEDLVKIEVQYLEATSDLQTLRLRNVDGTRLLEAKRAQLQDTHARLREARSKATQLQKTAEQASRLVSQEPDGDALVEQLREHDIDRLEADIGSEQARLELTHGGSSHLIKEFEDREKTIEHMRSKLADFEAKVAELSTAIGELRKQWEPRLEALIEKISDAFSDSFQRIGCAGQVTLGKAEDVGPNEFAEWSIVIHVAFRQNIPLSILNAHRQSGGERAVSTIFYLMALQSLSASPFRVVDEINQGMDPRNERMVHGRLVDIACASSEPDEFDDNGNPIGGGGGGQYFLITPKLLNGLVYKRGMRVLCIYSGEHMPEDSGKIDFKKAIRNHAADVASRKRNGQPRALQGNGQVNVYA